MRVQYKDIRKLDIPIVQINSVTFVKDGEAPSDPIAQVSLSVSWLLGCLEQGYYELLTIESDTLTQVTKTTFCMVLTISLY